MVLYPDLQRILRGEVDADEARPILRRLMDEHGPGIYTRIYHVLRCWLGWVIRCRRTDAEELDKWFALLQAVRVTMNRRETTDEYLKMQVLVDILFDYLLKLAADAARAADPFHREYLVHRRLGRFMRGDPLDFTHMRPPGEMSWTGEGDQCVEFIHVRDRSKLWLGIDRAWFERKVKLEGDLEISAGFDLMHMLPQEDA